MLMPAAVIPMMTSSNGNISVLLAICAGNSPFTGELPAQRPVTRSFDVFFDLRLNKRLSKKWWGWWFEAPSCPLWRHCNAYIGSTKYAWRIQDTNLLSIRNWSRPVKLNQAKSLGIRVMYRVKQMMEHRSNGDSLAADILRWCSFIFYLYWFILIILTMLNQYALYNSYSETRSAKWTPISYIT